MRRVLIMMLVVFMVFGLMTGGVMAKGNKDEAAAKTIDYVALGDSVAAGVLLTDLDGYPDEGSGLGYTDLIASKLNDADALGSYINLAKAGMTAARLAEESEVLKISTSPERFLVQQAELVTLDVGANDLLGDLYTYVGSLGGNVGDADPAIVVGILNQIAADVPVKGPAIQDNIETILRNILDANKDVKIYVMGYYNPLPTFAAAYGLDLDAPVAALNKYIKGAIKDVSKDNKDLSITYIATMEAMAESDANLYPTDIHPSELGYQVIAAEFWNKIKHILK